MLIKANRRVIIEPICSNGQHVKFNAAYLKKILNENCNIDFYSSYSHFEKIKPYLYGNQIEKIKHYPIEDLPDNKFINSLCFFYKLIKRNTHNNIDDFTLLSGDVFHLSAITLMSYLFYKNKFKIILHSVLEKNAFDKSLKSKILFFRRLNFWLRMFSFKKNNFLILLSNSIRKNFFNIYNFKGNVIIHQHPYIYTNDYKKKELSSSKRKIALVGIGDNSKGIDWLASQLNDLGDRFPNYTFYLMGRNISKFNSERLLEPCNTFVEDNIFNDLLNSMDFFIYPFDENSYKLRASGTIFDAISLRKPIITTENDFVIDILNSNKVKYISLYRNKTGISDLLFKLDKLSSSDYFEMQDSLNDLVKKVNV
ncbi:glycosyltransferase [Aliivibrio fischeri]|uniref:glycosyltransferase n=1 Tax=Aliivibrio fischeri TaxID=668 RepID=UPI001F3D07E2|nr:glycosyltransferase [Aliivibrio fischeri]MCE7577987.1 glycosyltransferase [Aliivibrio fischeri]MCE7590375.1 glycosyltransferase [Aliivibrio fischeri]